MFDLSEVKHHSAIEEIVDVLCNKTQTTDRGFFRTEVAYFLGKMASSMRAKVFTKDRGEIPVNIYALALATSGFGKGHSVGIIENEFLKGFKHNFMNSTFPTIAEESLTKLAVEKAVRNNTEQGEELESLISEFSKLGALAFTFDSGTVPAVKQMRHKLIMSDIGSINLQIDEIGSNLINNTELLSLFLELYDQGLVKGKLTKNTNDNVRGEELDGKTPTNMLLFGTPSKLLDGGQTEDAFFSLLETGYARRCLFGYGKPNPEAFNTMSAEEIFKKLIEPDNIEHVTNWSSKFTSLADSTYWNWTMTMDDPVAIKLLEYKIHCEVIAREFAEFEDIKKAEMTHRYFKALKLAGAYAFTDSSPKVTMDHLMQAILLVEESGIAFQSILTREKPYVKLAKYIASYNGELTHADLYEALPFYKSGNAARNEIMTLATAWGYKNHTIIKKTFTDGIEFFTGESLKETSLDEIIISYSDHFAYNYSGHRVKFFDLHKMTQADSVHWCNHHFIDEHRLEDKAIPPFNLIVIDVDGGVTLDTAQELLREYMFMTYTTKRHTEEENRFRLILPINYELKLSSDDYKTMLNSIMDWLPFPTDSNANQRSKKWESCSKGSYYFNESGKLLDILPFIPQTSKNEVHKQNMQKIESMDNLERWFAQRISEGNRNNNMLKYALALVDTGMDYTNVQSQILAFNKKLSNPLSKEELNNTILVTVAKKYN